MHSFIRARDPSILACSIKSLGVIGKNLNDKQLYDDTCGSNKSNKESLEVFLRIKKVDDDFSSFYDVSGNVLSCKLPAGMHNSRNIREEDVLTKKYTFSKIFKEDSTQEDIFNNTVKPRMLDFINGQNCTLLMYGASGSGKTFTIVGTDTHPGIIPRSLEYLFRTIPDLLNEPSIKPESSGKIKILSPEEIQDEIYIRQKLLNSPMLTESNMHIKTYKNMQQRLSNEPIAELEEIGNLSVAIWVSFAEIYNEQVYDLLQFEQPKNKPREKLKLVKNSSGQVFIKGLKTISVSSGVEAYQILQYGLHYLQYASTSVNSHSSRSHSIFTIKLAQYMQDKKEFTVSYFNFCDLAGAERLKKTLNKGERLKESNNINSSLLVLHRCICSVRISQNNVDKRHVIPFRESKLTTLFQRALSGHESIYMIVNLNPNLHTYDESQHVLNFSAIAKDIIVEPIAVAKPEKRNNNRFSQYMQARSTLAPKNVVCNQEKEDLQNAIEKLYNEIEQQRIENEENELAIRKKITEDYEKLLDKNEAMWKKRIKDLEECHSKELELRLKIIKDKYENEVEEQPRKRPRMDDSVIVLDESQVEEVQEIKKLQEELDTANKKITELEKALLNSELSKKELEKTLLDAHNDFIKNEEMLHNKDEEICKLKAKIYHLEEQQLIQNTYIDVNSKTIMDYQEEIDRLEESFSQFEQIQTKENKVIN